MEKKKRTVLFSVLGGICLSRGIDWSYMLVTGQLNTFFEQTFSSDNWVKVAFNVCLAVYAWLCPLALGIIFGVMGYKRLRETLHTVLRFGSLYLGSCAIAYLVETVLHYAFMYKFYGLFNLVFY
ncbi:MAG: hypothetical protein IKK58_01550 [Clostridia bacterium]|nr:hypothetical protein [Clostridia bacterium]